MKLISEGNQVFTLDYSGEKTKYFECDTPEKAISLLEKAWYLNDVKRKYTESARTIAMAEMLPGFKWEVPS